MDYNEEKLSEQQSLHIIQQMIQTAKQEQKDDGKGWIIWGWMLFVVSLLTYANIEFGWYDTAFFWNVFAGIVILYFLYCLFRYLFLKKSQRVKTYTSDLFDKLNSGFFIFLILIIFSMNLGVPPTKGFMLLIGLYGFWVLIYGTALNFKPSVIAAYITWAIAFAGLFIDKFIHPGKLGNLPDDVVNAISLERFQWVMIFHAFAVLCGYIIPGHIANKEFNKLNKKGNIIQSV
jgi:hypothetical protein